MSDHQNDEHIRKMMQSLDEDWHYNSQMAEVIMERVGEEVNHAVILQKYQRRVRIGMTISYILMAVLGVFFLFFSQ